MVQEKYNLKLGKKLCSFLMFVLASTPQAAIGNASVNEKNDGLVATGLFPRYPKDSICPKITSLFGSSTVLDGVKRKTLHKGIDAGRKGDVVIAPADGRVIAVWETNSLEVEDWNILISHTPQDLNLSIGNNIYYSQFSRLRFEDVRHLGANVFVKRGQPIGKVYLPGGDPEFPAEVHWEVYEIPIAKESEIKWNKNEFGFSVWWNEAARLVDPLYMLSLHHRKSNVGEVKIVPFTEGSDYSKFRGFSYFLECKTGPAQKK